jgi:SAM-dependent methyltransferase
MILDLGCGTAKVPGAIGVDNATVPGVDVVHDLMLFPYPFEDASATEIYLNHVIEHFVLADYQRIFHEAHRILKPGGVLHIRVPHVFSIAAWVDPTHKSAFTFQTAQFWTRGADKAYYVETHNLWDLTSTSARVTWFVWKRYRLRRLDGWLSHNVARLLDWLLRPGGWQTGADWFVRGVPMFFVEIRWDFYKPGTD